MAILYPKINKDNLFGPGSPVSVINQWFHSQKIYGINKDEDLPWLSLPTLLGGSSRVREQLTSKLNDSAGATKELGAPTKSNRKIRNQETSRKLEKDSYVIDALYHCRTSFLRHGNPLGFECESFEDTLAKVCQSSQQQPSLGPFSQRIRLEIALLMRGSDDMSHFTFWPTHKLFKTDGCMIIQKKVFRIQAGTAKVTALSTDDAYDKAFREKRQNHNNDRIIIVHELIFGPAFMHAVTQPALYFDLHQDDLIAFPQEDQKKFVNSLQ